MSLGIIHISHVPGRAEPADSSEMVTQLLFGEAFMILEKKGSWTKIQCAWDSYKCWIDSKQFLPISNEAFEHITSDKVVCVQDIVGVATQTDDSRNTPVVLGSTLPYFDGDVCQIGDKTFAYEGAISGPFQGAKGMLIENALLYLNAPYLWGGRSPFGIDCSGFTQVVYKLTGIKLPRDSSEQAKEGHSLSFVEEAEPGDLAFFDNDDGNIIHVGIMMGDNKIIHASGKVRIDKIDHQGIFNLDTGRYSHKLRIMKRIF